MDAMTRSHILRDVIFDIAFASEEDAFDQHMELGGFVQERLLEVICEVFDEVGRSEEIYSFDSLEVDLGEVAYINYQTELEERLRDRLRTLLQARLPSKEAEHATGTSVISLQRSTFEKLAYFLKHGYLPWNAGSPKMRTLEPLLQQVLQDSGEEFITFLKKKPQVSWI